MTKAIRAMIAGVGIAACPVLASPPEGPTPGSWSIDIGAAALRAPVYFGSRRTATGLFPQLGFTYGTRLQGSVDDGLRWSTFKDGPVQFGPVVEYRQSDRFRQVLPGRGMRDAVEAGGFIQLETPVARIEGRIRKAVNGYKGWSGDLSADSGFDLGRFTIGAEARLAWADERFVYGVYGRDAQGSHDRDGTIDAPTYLTAGLEGDIGYHLAPRLTVAVLVAHDRFLHAFQSDARERHAATQIGTAISWHFGTAPDR